MYDKSSSEQMSKLSSMVKEKLGLPYDEFSKIITYIPEYYLRGISIYELDETITDPSALLRKLIENGRASNLDSLLKILEKHDLEGIIVATKNILAPNKSADYLSFTSTSIQKRLQEMFQDIPSDLISVIADVELRRTINDRQMLLQVLQVTGKIISEKDLQKLFQRYEILGLYQEPCNISLANKNIAPNIITNSNPLHKDQGKLQLMFPEIPANTLEVISLFVLRKNVQDPLELLNKLRIAGQIEIALELLNLVHYRGSLNLTSPSKLDEITILYAQTPETQVQIMSRDLLQKDLKSGLMLLAGLKTRYPYPNDKLQKLLETYRIEANKNKTNANETISGPYKAGYAEGNLRNSFYSPPKVEQKIDEEIPEELKCPISMELMKNPVIASDGYTYEKKAIQEWLTKHDSSPMTREILNKQVLIPNRAIQDLITKYEKAKPEDGMKNTLGS